MLLVSTGFKTAIIGPKAFPDIFNGGRIALFDTVRPSSPDAAQPGPPIGFITAPAITGGGLIFVQSGPYIIKRQGDRWRFLADVTANPTWWRLMAPNDDGIASFDQARMDGDLGVAAFPSDMTLKQLSFDAGESLDIDSFLYTIPPLAGS